MKAVILAGGEGRRLRPLTCAIPKPMVPVMNAPVMSHTLRLLRLYGLTDVGVTLQYLPDRVQSYFGEHWNGIDLRYFVEDEPLGTAGGVRSAGDFWRERCLIVSGDALTDLDIGAAIAFHEKNGAAATLVLKRVETPIEYGVVLTRRDGRIDRFVEKPGWSEVYGDTANTGIYILEPEVWDGFAAGENFDFAKDLFPALMQRGLPVFGYTTQDYWCDIGSVEQYFAAHRDVFEGRCRVELTADSVDGVWVEDGAIVDEQSVIKAPCYIAAGARIGRGVAMEPYTVVGPGVQVGEEASLKRSICWENARLGARSQLRGALLCDGVDLGSGASVYENSVIGTGVSIGARAEVGPGVRIWPRKEIDAGQKQHADCQWGCQGELFDDDRIAAPLQRMTPELAARIGRAIALHMGQNARIAIASDGAPHSGAIKAAVVAGLLAGGADLCDLESALEPVLHFGVKLLHLTGGVYIGRSDESLSIRLFDGDGLPFLPAQWRALRNAFEMTPCAPMAEPGLIAFKASLTEVYAADAVSRVCAPLLRAYAGCAVISAEPAETHMLRLLFSEVGWHTLEADDGPQSAVRLARKQNALALGIENGGLAIYTQHERIAGAALDMFFAMLELQSGAESIWIDALAPDGIESLARQYSAQVERLHSGTLLRTLPENSLLYAAKTDPFVAALKTAEVIALRKRPIEEIASGLPRLGIKERSVAVARKDIGRVFRAIAEDQDTRRIDRTEGIRIRQNNGWVHLLPERGGRMRVIGGSFSEEYAESLADLFARRVNAITKTEERR